MVMAARALVTFTTLLCVRAHRAHGRAAGQDACTSEASPPLQQGSVLLQKAFRWSEPQNVSGLGDEDDAPPLLHIGAAKRASLVQSAQRVKPAPVELVWVRCHEDTSGSPLLQEAHRLFARLTVVEKCGEKLPPAFGGGAKFEELQVENLATEGYGYVSYITARYDSLPPWTLFVHGRPEDHNPDLLPVMESLRPHLPSKGWVSVNRYFVKNRTVFPSEAPWLMADLHRLLPEMPELKGAAISLYCCAQFLASRSAIRGRSAKFWKKYRDMARLEVAPRSWLAAHSDRTAQSEVGVMYEHLWHMVFGEDPKMQVHSSERLGEIFGNVALLEPAVGNEGQAAGVQTAARTAQQYT